MYPQLFKGEPGDVASWSCGSSQFFKERPVPSGSLVVAVLCRLGHLREDHALLDTAASWSVIGGMTAMLLESAISAPVGHESITTRHGTYGGQLHRLPVTFIADPGCGIDLQIEATCLVIPDWPGPNVLGYNGCLERIRFALDPGLEPDNERLYFGALSV